MLVAYQDPEEEGKLEGVLEQYEVDEREQDLRPVEPEQGVSNLDDTDTDHSLRLCRLE